jgi:hypothetical protein
MGELPDTFDDAALRKVSRIARPIVKLDRADQGAFIAITNAIEHHLEIWPRDAATVRHLSAAMVAFLRARDIDPAAAGFERQLRKLTEYGS